jgi:hypothetical protein
MTLKAAALTALRTLTHTEDGACLVLRAVLSLQGKESIGRVAVLVQQVNTGIPLGKNA